MISKEERAELRKRLSRIIGECPLPWSGDKDFEGEVANADGGIVASCEHDEEGELIAAAVNALPKTLGALDAADERIAGLEAEVAECHTALNERSVAAVEAGMDRLIASEIGKLETQVTSLQKRIAELEVTASEREELWRLREKEHALAARMVGRQADQLKEAKARIAELEAAAQWRPMDTAPRDGTEILVWCLGQHYELVAWEEHSCHQWIGDASRYDEDQVSAWLPIPALPEGGV